MGASSQPGGPELPSEVAAAVEELRLRSRHCPAPDLLQAAHAGVLPSELADPVLHHLEACATCKSLVHSLTALDDAPLQADEQQRIWNRIRAGRAAEQSVRGLSGWSWRVLVRPWPSAAVAFALVMVAITASLLRERQPAVGIRPARPAEVASSAPVLPLAKAPIVLPAAAFLLWRGQEEENPWKPLQAALAPYQSGDYAEAARRLQEVAAKYPRIAEGWFYLGVSRLFLSTNPEAAGDLEKARGLAQGQLADQAGWYLAVAKERTGKVNEARALLDELCRVHNEAKACLGLQTLPVIK